MSANTHMAPQQLSSPPAGAHSGSTLGRVAQRVKGLKADDLFINGLWVAFAAYGLAATLNVIVNY